LSEEARRLFYRLCCLEEGDREKWIIEAIWGDETAHSGELVTAGLVDAAYRIHPGVAEAGRKEAGTELRNSVDAEMAELWTAMFRQAEAKESEGMGGMTVRAGRSAVPYLMRQRGWEEATMLLERTIQRDKSPTTLGEVLPLLGRIVELTEGTEEGLENAGVFARALADSGRTREATARMQKVERQAVGLDNFRVASSAAGFLVNWLRESGHLEEALTTAERRKDYSRKAGLGRWTQLADEVFRLQILNEMGRHEEVLTTVQTRREAIRKWPESSDENESVNPWNVSETLLDTGRQAAKELQRWEEALSLNAENVTLKLSRGATKLEVARTRYNDYSPLLRLQRLAEARSLLYQCLTVFESDGGGVELGAVHIAIADLEYYLQHLPEAVRHASAALRYGYSVLSPSVCAIRHFNLGVYLLSSNAHSREALAHRLASTLIRYQMNHGDLPNNIQVLRNELAQVSPADVPASFDQVCDLVEQTEGVRFRDLFSRLPQRAASGNKALQAVLAMA
jgi:tetratricopeptide (TPR) repeat protein